MRVVAAFLLSVIACAGAGTDIPNTRAGQVFGAWLEAFNSGNRATVEAYVRKYEPDRVSRIGDMLNFRGRTGGFTLIRMEKSEPSSLEAFTKERAGDNYAHLALEISESDPPTVRGLSLRPARAPSDPAVSRLKFGDAVEALDRRAAERSAEDQFSGCVLVARGGKVAMEQAYGLADRDKHVPNTVDTKFRIGSMNKMFTATAILQLVEDGKIDLSAPLGKYLPDYPNREAAAKVTIRHLLTHTGGMGDIFTPEYDQKRLETRELGDYVKLFGSRAPEFEPGSKWSYANYGFVLLGLVIEKVSGIGYYDFVRKNIFAKAGMHDTDSLPENENVALRSVGYMRKSGAITGKWAENTDTLPWRGSSAGGGYSTAGDLFRFAEALSGGKLIEPALFAQMTSAQASEPQMPPGTHYGFGMMVVEEPQGPRFGHGGGAPGMNGELRVYPKTDTIVVALANLDPRPRRDWLISSTNECPSTESAAAAIAYDPFNMPVIAS